VLTRTAPILVITLACACRFNTDGRVEGDFNTAKLALLRGDLTQAETLATRGIEHTQSRSDSVWAWRFRLLLAEVALSQRSVPEAPPALSAELPAGHEYDELRVRQRYLDARRQADDGRLPQALETLSGARSLSRPDSDIQIEVDALTGQVQLRLRQWDKAEATLTHAVATAARSSDHYHQALALNNLGMGRLSQSRYDEALQFFDRVLSFDDLRDLTMYTVSLRNAGLCYARLGDFDRGLKTLQRAFEMHENRGPRIYFEQALGQLGTLYYLKGDPRQSLGYYDRALKVASEASLKPDAELWAGNLASANAELGQWDEADRYNEEAKRLWMETHTAPSVYHMLNSARIALGRGQLDESTRLLEQTIGVPGTPPSVLWDAHSNLAAVALLRKQPARAATEFEAALTIIETTRAGLLKTDYKISYLTQLISFYQAYVTALLDQGRIERALEVADSSRGQVLAEREKTSAPARAGVAAFRRVARESGAVLLSYWLAPERSFMWVVSPSGIRLVPLPPAKDIEALVRQHQKAIANVMADPLGGRETAGDKLYQTLVAPAAQWIPKDARVVIVPDGALHGINFETLPVDGPRRHYWIEDVQIEVAPSLATLATATSATATATIAATATTAPAAGAPVTAGRPRLLLIGNPTPHEPDFPRLQYAAAEMSGVAAHFGHDGVTWLDGDRASPGAYGDAHPDRFAYVHFTAHASANIESPLDSVVVLSGPDDRYKLYARDVAALRLNAELVTISACRSAGERAYSGEGLVGFSWAFLKAGARHVIAGLWDVDDRSTPELMDRLYAGIAAGQSPAHALRSAKLALIGLGGASAAPYRWAPLELFTAAL
jgi:CHAT domain-containing protein/tetratricopeptide (TPR) repeat protein